MKVKSFLKLFSGVRSFKMPAVKSTHIAALDHDRASQTLRATFHDQSVYAYAGVPEGLYQRCLTAPSVGQFFHAQIQPKFKATQLAPRRPR